MPNGTYGWCERGYELAPTRFIQSKINFIASKLWIGPEASKDLYSGEVCFDNSLNASREAYKIISLMLYVEHQKNAIRIASKIHTI